MAQYHQSSSWTGVKRADGVLIVATFSGAYFIMPADEGPVIDRCPTCGRPLESEAAARAVADFCLPCAA